MIKTITDKEIEERKNLQNKAMTKCRLLGYVTTIAREVGCITSKQHKLIIDKVFEIQRMLYSWQQSDINRLSGR